VRLAGLMTPALAVQREWAPGGSEWGLWPAGAALTTSEYKMEAAPPPPTDHPHRRVQRDPPPAGLSRLFKYLSDPVENNITLKNPFAQSWARNQFEKAVDCGSSGSEPARILRDTFPERNFYLRRGARVFSSSGFFLSLRVLSYLINALDVRQKSYCARKWRREILLI